MEQHEIVIERLRLPVSDEDIAALAALLVDAVDSGAAVSFLAPLSPSVGTEWWRRTVSAVERSAIILVARDGEGIAGSVQLHKAWAPNQPHRGEIAKLLVHRRARRRGLGERLMREAESAALEWGLTLLTLDARSGGAAERLYRRLGWNVSGVIPRYAVNADGKGLHDTVVFYKEIGSTRGH